MNYTLKKQKEKAEQDNLKFQTILKDFGIRQFIFIYPERENKTKFDKQTKL